MSSFSDYLPIYEGDRYCLMCAQACPVRRVTKNEATSPHGWALLVASITRGQLQWDSSTIDVLYQCADCGLCQANCVTDRPLPYAIVAARAHVVEHGDAPSGVTELNERLRKWGNPYGATTDDGRTTNSGSPVTILIGDAAYHLRPQVVAAAETVLGALGVAAPRIAVGRSSGYLPYSVGLWDTARELAHKVVDELKASGATQVVTLGTEDAHTLLHVYAELGVPLPDDVKVTTLSEYLESAVEDGRFELEGHPAQTYTYHDGVQAVRLKLYAPAARRLAVRVMGGAPREMLYREALATPVGTSGGLQFTQPELAAQLARVRIQEARETGADILLTDNPLDTATLDKYADGIRVVNLIEEIGARISSRT